MYKAENINLSIGKKDILKNASCEVKPQEFIAILGANGAGKSSLLKCLTGILGVNSGTISLDNQNIGNYSENELARKRAVLSQNVEINFPFSVYEVVEMGLSPYSNSNKKLERKNIEIIDECLRKVDGDNLKSRDFSSLSGGEKQRVQLARILAQLTANIEDNEEKYLFLDEPTSALDLKHQQKVMKIAKNLSQNNNIGVIAIVHDINLAKDYADKVILMKDGEVINFDKTEICLTEEKLKNIYDVDIVSIEDKDKNLRYFTAK